LCQFSNRILAQTGSISGELSDTTNYKPMVFCSVSLIKKDSSIFRNQFSNQKSQFRFSQLPADTYTLLITRPSYADYKEELILKEGEEKNLGMLVLLSKENLLREVLIKDHSAIKIKGDTTEFLVDSFLVNKNSNVEDLLKRLPGLQVDKDGKITAQGQEVKKVLVDGEEFFGDDPTVATKNLRADNVETVQVFDQKSEQTIQTGVDDGTKEKTINLTLKENSKKGYFGKVGAGYGTKNESKVDGVNQSFGNENRYEGEAMYNNFKNKRKFSVFSTVSNTNKTGLGWEDREKYMGGNNMEYDEASGYMYSFFEGDPNGYNGNGIPQTTFMGAFYGDKIKKDKLSYSLTATRKQSHIQGIDKNFTQYILPDTMYFNTQVNKMDNNRNTNTINGKSELQIDSTSSIKIKANLTQTNFDNRNTFSSENYNGLSQIVNKNNRENHNQGYSITGNYSLLYVKRFAKLGRSITLQWDQRITDNQSEGNLLSNTTFYNGDTINSINSEQNLDQLKLSEEKGNNFGAKATYTEPLTKTWSMILDYDYHLTLNHSLINSLVKTPSGGYTNRIDSLSNDLKYNIGIQKGGISWRYITKKINTSFGGRISQTQLTQENLIKDTTSYQNFFNVFPSARFNYKIGTTKSIGVNYSGNTRQPSLQQINPIQDLSNPLVIYKGNPNLKQLFSNSFSLNYNSYKPITGRSLYLSASYSFTYNDFANYDEVDNLGRKLYKTVNVDGNQSASGYAHYYFKLSSKGLGLSQSISPSYSKNANFINGLSNTNYNTRINYDIDLYYEKEEVFEVNFSPGINYSKSKTSLRPDATTEFFIYSFYSSINVYLPKKFEWFIDGQWNIGKQTDVFTKNNNNVLISAFVSRKFLKGENLIAKIGVEDLLNQNIGFSRNANSNYINENTYLVLRRYFLFSLTYEFTKSPAK
ncbi:MAG: TonB-dependent receptor family protein, partial [Bacteroidia bacterium]|nr:TonB-dependent receptor family protein [Bacteroidia bacterium]